MSLIAKGHIERSRNFFGVRKAFNESLETRMTPEENYETDTPSVPGSQGVGSILSRSRTELCTSQSLTPPVYVSGSTD